MDFVKHLGWCLIGSLERGFEKALGMGIEELDFCDAYVERYTRGKGIRE